MTSTPILALIVDDEPLARRLLREFLSRHADVQVMGECANGFEAVAALSAEAGPVPDLVFLDMQMPRMTGLEVLALTQRDHGVIFTTAHDQYAVQAFDQHAVDYLLKPFSQARFDQALAKARQQLSLRQPGLQQAAGMGQAKPLERLLVRDRQQVHVVPLDQVLCIEAQDDYVCIHTPGRSLLKTQRLSELEAQLDPARFVRVHRSWLLNLAHLQRLERGDSGSLLAHVQGGHVLPVSRSRAAQLQAVVGG